jgi:preprotein translocase subunit SecD
MIGATLTLPGIAGIVLTIGMAVDANVLIFERIREELNLGKTALAAIDSGYDKAFSTIMDANITTLIAAIVLFQFGTGPIKGFAVTLSVGILASMFTAIVVTRAITYLAYRNKKKIETLSI